MSPLVLVAKKEIKVAIRERIVVALGVIITLLLAISVYAGFLSYQQQKSVIEKTQAEKREEWLNQGDKHPHIAAHFGTFIFKPKTAISLFDFGLDAFTGTSIYLEAHHQHEFMFRPAQDHSTMIRFGELSAALVLKILVPLLIIFLAFGCFTRERESGTFSLLLSQGVSMRSLVWGKILAFSLMLSCILLPFFLCTILLTAGGDSSNILHDLHIRTMLLIVSYGAYLFLFIAFAVWTSLHAASGRNALLTLLSVWIVLTILMPKVVANVSENLYVLPSMRAFKADIEHDKAHGLDGASPRSARIARLEAELLKEYQVDSVEELPFNFEGVMMQAGEEYSHQVYDHHFGKIKETFSRQNRLSSIASLINPYMSIQNLSMAFSGTDIYSFIHFEEVVESYRREMIRKMNNDMAENSKYGEFYEYAAGSELWHELRDFSYRSPSIWSILKNYTLEIIGLIAWLVLSLILLFQSGRTTKPLYD